MPENTQTLACDMAALPTGGRRRLKELSEELLRSVDEIREMPEGFNLRFFGRLRENDRGHRRVHRS